MTGANIIENSEQYGVVTTADYGLQSFYDKDMREDDIKCFLAGGIAEQYYCYRKCIKYNSENSDSDYGKIIRLFYEGHNRFRSFEGFEKRVNQLKRDTEKQIKAKWSFIEVVAEAFLKKDHLTKDEINKLWRQK